MWTTEKIGRSTDYWDALMLTFAFQVLRKDPLEQYRAKTTPGEYDPIQRHFGPAPAAPVDHSSLYPHQGMDDYNPIK